MTNIHTHIIGVIKDTTKPTDLDLSKKYKYLLDGILENQNLKETIISLIFQKNEFF